MPIHGRKLLFVKPGHTMEEPTDADFAEQDKEEARLQKAQELREKLLERAAKKRGKARDAAVADIEADIAALEAE